MVYKTADIVTRLRERGSEGADLSPGDPLCAEAADKIEHLLKLLDFAAAGLTVVERRRDSLRHEVEKLRIENEALRQGVATRTAEAIGNVAKCLWESEDGRPPP